MSQEAETQRAIEEMLNECQTRAMEDSKGKEQYKLGDERKGRKRPLRLSGQAREAEEPSQSEARRKQSTGMDRGQRHVSGGTVFQNSTGEGNGPSQFACQPPSRLDFEPCREEPLQTELEEQGRWQRALQIACDKK